jgi:hypothetical protein
VIASQARQTNFSRTCWITFHWRGMSSSISVMSSPIVRGRVSHNMGGSPAPNRQCAPVASAPAPASAPACGARMAPSQSCRPWPSAPRFRLARDSIPDQRELQLELIQQRSLLRGLSELLVPQLLDHEFELLDKQYLRLTSASAANRAARSVRSIACSVVTSSGRESSALIADQRITICGLMSEPSIVSSIQIPAISQPLAVATCVATFTSKCPPANSQAGSE